MQEPQPKTETSSGEGVVLRVTEDRMNVLLSVRLDENKGEASVDIILAMLEEEKIKSSPDRDALVTALREARDEGRDLIDYTVASGTVPTKAEDGKLHWTGDYFKEGYFIDPETKKIDFHRRVGNPAVEKGQLLVRVQYGKPGVSGCDVYGRKIAVPKMRQVHLKAGRHVEWDEDEKGFRAMCDGRVRLRGQSLEIDETYFVRDGVGNNTGNISHNGQIVIQGDVEPDYKIEALGNIEVRGLIYASDIKCGGNLIAKEGINENPARKIYVKGDILTKYILNANILAEGNIMVNREIFQSQVRTRGEITCNKGRIVGGEVAGTRGIYVGEAGSKGDVKTILIAGVDFYIQNRLKQNGLKSEKLKLSVKKMKAVYTRLNAMHGYLTAEQKEALTELNFKMIESEDEISGLEDDDKKIRKALYAHKNSRIVIYDMVYPNTVLRIFDSQYVVEDALAGPMMAILDPVTGDISLTSEIEDKTG